MRIIISLSIMLLILATTSTQSPVYMYSFCENSTTLISTSYKNNLNKVLSWVTSDSATSKGYNTTIISNNNNGGGDDDGVYGLYDCRIDLTGYFCQFCLTSAVNEIARRCPNSLTAIIWYDICVFRYSNQSFFGKVGLSPTWNITGSTIIKVMF